MKKIKEILINALYGMLRSYEGKRFWPSLILKLGMALASAMITAFFANTLFSKNNTANQIFAALFFYFLITAVSNLIREIKRGGVGKRLKTTVRQYGAAEKARAVVFRCRRGALAVSAVCLCTGAGGAAVCVGAVREKIPCCSASRMPSQRAKIRSETARGWPPLRAVLSSAG